MLIGLESLDLSNFVIELIVLTS